MVRNSEFGFLIPDPAWRSVLVCDAGCRGGACWGRGLATCGPSEGGAFSQPVSALDALRCSAYAASKIVLVVSGCYKPAVL